MRNRERFGRGTMVDALRSLRDRSRVRLAIRGWAFGRPPANGSHPSGMAGMCAPVYETPMPRRVERVAGLEAKVNGSPALHPRPINSRIHSSASCGHQWEPKAHEDPSTERIHARTSFETWFSAAFSSSKQALRSLSITLTFHPRARSAQSVRIRLNSVT